MQRVYFIRHAKRMDNTSILDDESERTISTLARFLSEREAGKKTAVLASPENFAFITAETIYSRLESIGNVKLGFPGDIISGDPYTGHNYAEGPFPHFGLCECPGLPFASPTKIADTLPYFKKIGEELQEKINAQEINMDNALKQFYEKAVPFCNSIKDPEIVKKIIANLEDVVDTTVLISHFGIIKNTVKDLTGEDLILNNLQGVCFEGEKVYKIGPKNIYTVLRELTQKPT